MARPINFFIRDHHVQDDYGMIMIRVNPLDHDLDHAPVGLWPWNHKSAASVCESWF